MGKEGPAVGYVRVEQHTDPDSKGERDSSGTIFGSKGNKNTVTRRKKTSYSSTGPATGVYGLSRKPYPKPDEKDNPYEKLEEIVKKKEY